MSQTLAQSLTDALRSTAHAYSAGDQVPPCAVLWSDPERLWESVLPDIQAILPELFSLGSYSPEQRSGPAVWLRCVEARVVDAAPPAGTTPVFYLPGVSQARLRIAEDCPPEIAALVELRYRGVPWLHPNGKEWTPHAFLASKQGGLALDVPKDQATLDALAGALPTLIAQSISQLQGRRLDSQFFNELVAPDATGLLLLWLNDPDVFKQRRSDAEWKAFRQQCKVDFHFDPVKEGPLTAAKFMAGRGGAWGLVWQRFSEVPAKYPGIVDWLNRAAPQSAMLFDSAEVWPSINQSEERKLAEALELLVDRPQDEVIQAIGELEAEHGPRRRYPWARLGRSPLAILLEPLEQLAKLCQSTPGAPTADKYAEAYAAGGWQVDAAALATMALCGSPEQHGAILKVLRAVYLPWLESTSRHLQKLVQDQGKSVAKRAKPIEPLAGRLVLFADGLRLDVAKQLVDKLAARGLAYTEDWEWSTVPSVTATAKPAASPIAGDVQGGEAGDQFTSRLVSTGQVLSQDRFATALKGRGWQVLGANEKGDPSGSAWTEAGSLDKKGHTEGWKLARGVATEVQDLVSRIRSLLGAGWKEVIVVTDHGWLLLPGGLPKIDLKASLSEHKWGRCAALKADAQTDVAVLHWHWNPLVSIASPPGVGCYRASVEYTHGGISLQEMVTPVLRVKAGNAKPAIAQLREAKWTGAKCRISVSGSVTGVRVDIRTTQSDPATSLLSDRMSVECPTAGKVTVFLENDSDIGRSAAIVLLDKNGQVIGSLPTTLGQ